MTLQVTMDVVRVRQPLGDLYVGTLPSRVLWELAEYDMREIRKREDGIYLATGVQRDLNQKRVDEIAVVGGREPSPWQGRAGVRVA